MEKRLGKRKKKTKSAEPEVTFTSEEVDFLQEIDLVVGAVAVLCEFCLRHDLIKVE